MWRVRTGTIFATSVATLALSSCAGELSGDPDAYRVHFEPGCNVVPLFAQHCSGDVCHSPPGPQVGLDLVSPRVGERLLGAHSKSAGCESRILIDPDHVQDSFILEKIGLGKPQCGDNMPLTGEITDADRICIRTWAAALAGVDASVLSQKDGGAHPPRDGGAPKTDAGAKPKTDAAPTPDGGTP
jgi:hypothetical protein